MKFLLIHKQRRSWLLGCACAQIASALLAYPISAQVRIHPDDRYLPRFSAPEIIVNGPENALESGPDYYATLAMTDSVTIGAEEGTSYEMLGDIADIAISPSGHIFVLDSEYNEVLICGSDGSHLGSFGHAGDGPGEFASAKSLSLMNSGNIAVVFAERTNVFERQQDGHYEFRNSFRGVGTNGCAMNDHVYILRHRPGLPGIIHKVTLR